MKTSLKFVFALCAAAMLPMMAADIAWTGAAATDDWFAPGNWSGNSVPSEGDDVTIGSGASVLLSASTPALSSLSVSGTLTMTNWTTCLNATVVTIPSGGILTCGAAATNEADLSRVWIKCTDLTIASGGKIDVNYKGYAGHPKDTSAYHAGYGPGGSYLAEGDYSAGPSHGGHGGRRMEANSTLPIIMPYDNPENPELPGSSGTSSKYAAGGCGGGVVKIKATGVVVVNGSILADGQDVSQYGKTGDNHEQAGAGGSINISCRAFAGVGILSANGGGGENPFTNIPANPAGGGMIAVHYDVDAERVESVEGMTITANAGQRLRSGASDASKFYQSSNVDDKYDDKGVNAGMGTLHFTDAQIVRQLAGKTLTGNVLGISSFVHDGDWLFSGGRVMFGEEGVKVTVNGNLIFSGDDSRLEIGGGVTTNWDMNVVMYAGAKPSKFTVTGDLTLGGISRLDIRSAATNGTDKFGAFVKVGGTMTISENCFVYSWSDCENLGSPHFEVGALYVQAGGVFSAFGRGGRGTYDKVYTSHGSSGNGKGHGGGKYSAGGSHGGRGGYGYTSSGVSQSVYDDVLRPCLPGSGGGAYNTRWGVGGAGGGLVFVSATNGTIRVDGTIDVSGRGALDIGNGYGGGGSGGTIFLEANKFCGGTTGRLIADGGDTKPSSNLSSGSGGGGRIAVWCGGRPWALGMKPSKVNVSETPIVDNPDYMSYLGTYSAKAGEKIGDYGTDENVGEAGTVRFCFVPPSKGFVLIAR